MNIYKAPDTEISLGSNKSNKGKLVSKLSFGISIFIALYKLFLFQFVTFSQQIIIVFGLLIFILLIVGFVCGLLGLLSYFKSKNKFTLFYSLIGTAVSSYFIIISALYTIDAMQRFNAAS